MKHRNRLKIGQLRKYNTYLDNCAKSVHSPALKIMITSRKIHWRGNGHLVQKGH